MGLPKYIYTRAKWNGLIRIQIWYICVCVHTCVYKHRHAYMDVFVCIHGNVWEWMCLWVCNNNNDLRKRSWSWKGVGREKEMGREGTRRGRIWDGNDGNKLFTYESFKNGLKIDLTKRWSPCKFTNNRKISKRQANKEHRKIIPLNITSHSVFSKANEEKCKLHSKWQIYKYQIFSLSQGEPRKLDPDKHGPAQK